MRAHRSLAALVVASLLGGCGGAVQTVSPAAGGIVPSSRANARTGNVRFAVRLAKRSTQAKRRQYVDPQTAGLTIAQGSTLVAVIDFSKACSPPDAQGTAICTATATLPVGQNTYTVRAIDALSSANANNGASATLSAVVVPINVNPSGPNVVDLALGGVPTSFTATLGSLGVVPKGTPTAVPVAITLRDQLNAIIVGGEPLVDQDGNSVAVVVATNDPVHTPLSVNGGPTGPTASLTRPSDNVVARYDGSTNGAGLTVSLSSNAIIGMTASTSLGLVAGSSFVPVIEAPVPLPTGVVNLATMAAIPGSGDFLVAMAIGGLNPDVIERFTPPATFAPCANLSTSGVNGDDVSVVSLATVGSKILGIGLGATQPSPGFTSFYSLDLTSCQNPLVGPPLARPEQFSSLAQAVTSGGKMWVGAQSTIDVSVFGLPTPKVAVYAVSSAANAPTEYDLPDAEQIPTIDHQLNTPQDLCLDASGRVWHTGLATYGYQAPDGTFLGSFAQPTIPLTPAALFCTLSTSDNALWLGASPGFGSAQVPGLYRIAFDAAGNPKAIQQVTDIAGYSGTNGSFKPQYFAHGTTASDASKIYFFDFSANNNPPFVSFDTVTHVAIAASNPTFNAGPLIPTNDGNFYSLSTFALQHIVVHP